MVFYQLKNGMRNIVTGFNKLSQRSFTATQYVLIFFVIQIFALSSIIRANYNYIDDLGRVVEGYRGWDNFSRHTSNILASLFHTHGVISDISPLSQILAAVFLSFAALCLTRSIDKNQKKYSLFQLFAPLTLTISPYFLECLSYKFDSPYMALSVLCAIIPFALKIRSAMSFIITTICVIVVCTTYQVSLSIILILMVSIPFCRLNNGRSFVDVIKELFPVVVGFLFGLVLFKVFLLQEVNTYVSTTISIGSHVFENYVRFLSLLIDDWNPLWRNLTILVVVSFLISFIYKSKNKILALIYSILTVVGVFLFAFGFYPLLEHPLMATRAMYGIGAAISILCVYISSRGNALLGSSVVALSWAFFVFCFIYGNSLHAQSSYTTFRTTLLIHDLNGIEAFNKEKHIKLTVKGDIGRSPLVKNAINKSPVLGRLIPSTLGDGEWIWSVYSLLHHYNLRDVEYVNTFDYSTEVDTVISSRYHDVYKKGDHFLVYMK